MNEGLYSGIFRLGLKPRDSETQSFRVRRATDLAITGMFENIIEEPGQWASNAYSPTLAISFMSTILVSMLLHVTIPGLISIRYFILEFVYLLAPEMEGLGSVRLSNGRRFTECLISPPEL